MLTDRLRLVAVGTSMLAIVAPLATEIAGARRAIGGARASAVTSRVTGVGRQSAEDGVAAVAELSPDAIVMIGFSGGADPDLRTGDLHVAEVFHSADGMEPITAAPGLTNSVKAWARGKQTRLVCGPSVTVKTIADSKSKSTLHAATGAMSVNMEDYWAASAASTYGIPFASVRAVLDTAQDELPEYLIDAGDGIFGVLRGLAIHPGSAPDLIRLAWKARVARRRLADCVSGLLEAPPVLTAGTVPLIP